MNRCDVIMGVVIINFLFKCAQRVILLVCKVSLSFHISFLSYRAGALCATPGIWTPKKPRGNRVKDHNSIRKHGSYTNDFIFSSTFSAITVCNIHFWIWKKSKFIFMRSRPLVHSGLQDISIFGQKQPIWTAHHSFLEIMMSWGY